jgi:hypothetical protein
VAIALGAVDGKIEHTLISDYFGGKPFLISCTIANNGTSLSTKDVLVDTEPNGYIFVSRSFAARSTTILQIEEIQLFPAGEIGQGRETVDLALRGTLRTQNRTLPNQIFLVINCAHDLMIGKLWLARHNVLPDCKNLQLIFPSSWKPDPPYWKDISLDHLPLERTVEQNTRPRF